MGRREAYFMNEVARGETLASDGEHSFNTSMDNSNLLSGSDNFEAALCFYKALKVYPTPSDLITIYDKVGYCQTTQCTLY